MFEWLFENSATVIVCVILAVITAFIIVKLIKDKKAGKSSCGCNCSCCPMSGACHKK